MGGGRMTYAIYTVFGVVYAILGPAQYNMEQCNAALDQFVLPAVLEAEVHCVLAKDKPEIGVLSVLQQDQVNAWLATRATP